MISTQKELRAAFWRDNPDASRRMIPAFSGSGRMFCTDTRVAWCDYVDHAQRSGLISEALADRATLQPGRVSYEYEIQGNYAHGWECVCSEDNRREALQRLREYRENESAEFRLRRRRIITARGE